MEVVLLEPVARLGKTGDKVTVKNGFARNFLIPRGIALRASKENLAYFEEKRAEIEKENASKQKAAEALSKKIEGLTVTIIRQAAEDGRLFGSVTVREVALAVNEKGHKIESKEVDLLTPIKAVGHYKVRIKLHAEVSVEINVNVARSETEADNQAAAASASPAPEAQA